MRALRARMTGQRGFALPAALVVLTVTLMLAAAAGMAAMSATDTANRDVRVKRALAAAEAGLEAAQARTNSLAIDLDNVLDLNQQCVVSTDGVLSLLIPTAGGWCNAVTEDLGTGSSYSYQVSPVTNLVPALPPILLGNWNGALSRKIVATGKADCPGTKCVQRRLYAEMTANAEASGGPASSLNLLESLDLQLYRREAGSFRECSPTAPNPSVPDSGC